MKKNRKYSGSQIEDIRRYLNDEMTAAERNAFERKMQADPFLAAAVEGYAHIDDEEGAEDINALQRRIKSRAAGKSNFVYRVAAAAAIVLVASSVLLVKNFRQSGQQIAENRELKADESPEPRAYEPSESKSAITPYTDTVKMEQKEPAPGAALTGLADSGMKIVFEKEIKPVVHEADKTDDAVVLDEMVIADKQLKAKGIEEGRPAAVTAAEKETSKKVAGVKEVVAQQVPVIELSGEAKPQPGYDEYREYLAEKQVYPQALKHMGRVTVSLELVIQADGRLGEIRVLESPAKAFSDEATRLVREGPDWLPAFKDGKAVRDTVKLELIFF